MLLFVNVGYRRVLVGKGGMGEVVWMDEVGDGIKVCQNNGRPEMTTEITPELKPEMAPETLSRGQPLDELRLGTLSI